MTTATTTTTTTTTTTRTRLASPGDLADALIECEHDETACEVCANIVPLTDARHSFPWWRAGDGVVHCNDCAVQ